MTTDPLPHDRMTPGPHPTAGRYLPPTFHAPPTSACVGCGGLVWDRAVHDGVCPGRPLDTPSGER